MISASADTRNSSHLRAMQQAAGSRLPNQFGPWQAVGVVRPDKDPPYNVSRHKTQKAIKVDGFQLWRLKPNAAAA